MKKIALTLYGLREHCKTLQDLDSTLRRVKEIGYSAIQVSGINYDNISYEEVRQSADKYHLNIIASHENMQQLENDIDTVIRKLKIFDCQFTALGGLSLEEQSKENFQAGIDRLVKVAEKLDKEGIAFGYHNHDHEFKKVTDKNFLEELCNRTENTPLKLELDVHWVARGGGNPEKWIRKVAGRMPVVHIKDYTVLGNSQPVFCEIGEGNLDWEGILKALEETKVDWYVVEQDQPFPGRDIFTSSKISYKNLNKMGLE